MIVALSADTELAEDGVEGYLCLGVVGGAETPRFFFGIVFAAVGGSGVHVEVEEGLGGGGGTAVFVFSFYDFLFSFFSFTASREV